MSSPRNSDVLGTCKHCKQDLVRRDDALVTPELLPGMTTGAECLARRLSAYVPSFAGIGWGAHELPAP